MIQRIRAEEFRAAFADEMTETEWHALATSPLEELVTEFHRVFRVPNGTHVPPYESVYTDIVPLKYSPHMVAGAGEMPTRVGGLLWGPSTLAIARAYAEAGFAVAPVGEPPDHIGIELQFLAKLLIGGESCSGLSSPRALGIVCKVTPA